MHGAAIESSRKKGLTGSSLIHFFHFFQRGVSPHTSSPSENHGYVEKGKKERKNEINPSAREVFGAELLSCVMMKEGEESETTSAGSLLVSRQVHAWDLRST
jgi:hypothetical protein